MTSIEACRRAYAEAVVRASGSDDARLIAAFAAVPRESHLGPPPWIILDDPSRSPAVSSDPRRVYADVLVSLARERGINNGQPSLHALCLAACAPQPGETVVHVGAGGGYYSAILALLVGPAGRVVAYEIEPDLAALARASLAHLEQVEVVAASATAGPLPAADVIYVNAGATHPPAAWLDALRLGGRLILPLTPEAGYGLMLLITRRAADCYAAEAVARVAFIDCIGARDEAAAGSLGRALRTRPIGAIRSLRRGSPPDDTAWCVGRGWWLSTADQ